MYLLEQYVNVVSIAVRNSALTSLWVVALIAMSLELQKRIAITLTDHLLSHSCAYFFTPFAQLVPLLGRRKAFVGQSRAEQLVHVRPYGFGVELRTRRLW